MANVQKYPAAASGHMAAHFERRKDENGEYIRFGNTNIDLDRTPMNYNLAPDHEGGQIEFINQRISEVRCQKRADVNVMCSWTVTLPKYLPGEDPGKADVTEWPDIAREQFFERSYAFLANRYGEKNVISAYVHMDEKTPHMHFAFVPVAVDRKRGGEKVCAKEVLTKRELQTFHGDFELYHGKYRDWNFEILNEMTRDGNKTVAELKKETYHAEIVQARQEASESRISADRLQGDIKTLGELKESLERDLVALQTKKETLTTAEVVSLKSSKTITGALKGVSYEDFEALRRTARRVDSVDAEKNKALEQAKKAEERAAAAEVRARAAQTEKPSMKLTMENGKLQSRLKRMEGWLTRLLDYLPDQFRTVVQNILRDREPFPQRQDRELHR